MLRFNRFRLMLAGLMVMAFLAVSFAGSKPRTDWKKFSQQLLVALQSENTGLQASAMQRIIQYFDSLDIYQARYPVMDIFLKSDNPQVRQLALVTLHKIHSRFDLGYLQLHYPFEKDQVIKNQIAAVLLSSGWHLPTH